MLSFKEWLQNVLDNSYIVHNGERHSASDVYTPDMLDQEFHDYAWDNYQANRAATIFWVTPNGETWEIV